MKKKDELIIYGTLLEQYKTAGLPTNLILHDSQFTVFNLAELNQAMPFHLPPSRLNFFVFGFIKNAKGFYVIDEQKFVMQDQTIYFTNPGHIRSFSYDHIDEVYLVTFSEDFLKEHFPGDVFADFPFLLAETLPAMATTPAVYVQFERLYLQIHQEYLGSSPFRKKLIGSLFYTLLLKYKEHFWLNYHAIYEGNRGSDIVKQFKRNLEQHYRELASGKADTVCRLQDYADKQHLHPSYLSSVIKTKTGKTIGSWITDKSIAEAKSLLLNTSLPVKEIAYRLGFSDNGNFSAHFKKNTGVSPLEYRRSK